MRSAVVCCFLAPAVALVTRLSPHGAAGASSRRPSSLRALPAGAAPASSSRRLPRLQRGRAVVAVRFDSASIADAQPPPPTSDARARP
jgi:hypothetical protein